jgi:hypothetical protein
MTRSIATLLVLLVALGVLLAATAIRLAQSQQSQQHTFPEFIWKQSLPIRSGDPGITKIGGTEVRALAVFDGKLFAAIGYWMDTERENLALPGAQVLRLDDANSDWQIDFQLDERMPAGRRRYQAISNLKAVRFNVDDGGAALDPPVDLLLAGVWSHGGLEVFSRVTGAPSFPWSRIRIPGHESAPPGSQVRSFSLHRDQVTGIDVVFAGASNAIFVGTYHRSQKSIVWNPQPEWQGDMVGRPAAKGRVSSFAECNGRLYAAVYDAIYERSDGTSPTWKKVFETTIHARENSSVTGLRGLTSIANPSGSGQVLLASVEDDPSRVYRIDPNAVDASGHYRATLDLDVTAFLTQALGTEASYVGLAYNDTTEYTDSVGRCSYRFIGLEVITPRAAETFSKDHFNSDAHYLIRDCGGNYVLQEIQDLQIVPKPVLVSVRALAVSPFASDPIGTVYSGGFDANNNPVHNTAWLYSGIPVEKDQPRVR